MKIYQLHKYGGEWEDHYDYIVNSYLHKNVAEQMLRVYKAQEEVICAHSRRCDRCPIWEQIGDNVERIAKKCADYCDQFKRESYEDGSLDCCNWMSHRDESNFRIEEVEVIE